MCGVIGHVVRKGAERPNDLRVPIAEAIRSINHRGQSAHGLAYLDDFNRINVYLAQGPVTSSKYFRTDDDGLMVPSYAMPGTMIMGQGRYPTSGGSQGKRGNANVQPFLRTSPGGIPYALGHNGNMLSFGPDAEIPRKAARKGWSDAKVATYLIGDAIDAGPNRYEELKKVLENVVGSYSMIILVGGEHSEMIVMRDPRGYMPLSVGESEKGFYAASESIAFTKSRFNAESREVNPGELVAIDQNGMKSISLFEPSQTQLCMLQLVYMMHSSSKVNDITAYTVRLNLGAKAAVHYTPDVDFVVGVPHSGMATATGYANARGIPVKEVIMRENMYDPTRYFIQDDEKEKDSALERKFSFIPELIVGQRILVADDSIVRSKTGRFITRKLREYGATEVHLLSSSPPIVSQCTFGVDTYNDELVARKFLHQNGGALSWDGSLLYSNGKINPAWPDEQFHKQMADELNVQSIYYNTTSDLVAAIKETVGFGEKELCLSCLTGHYPDKVQEQLVEIRRRH